MGDSGLSLGVLTIDRSNQCRLHVLVSMCPGCGGFVTLHEGWVKGKRRVGWRQLSLWHPDSPHLVALDIGQ